MCARVEDLQARQVLQQLTAAGVGAEQDVKVGAGPRCLSSSGVLGGGSGLQEASAADLEQLAAAAARGGAARARRQAGRNVLDVELAGDRQARDLHVKSSRVLKRGS